MAYKGGGGVVAGTVDTVPKYTSAGAVGNSTLIYDGANVLALRNAANPQTFNLYNVYVSGSNNSRLEASTGAGFAQILAIKAGAGQVQDLYLGTGDAGSINFKVAGSVRWSINPSGELIPSADNVRLLGGVVNRIAQLFTGPGTAGSPGVAIGTTGTGFFSASNGDMQLAFAGVATYKWDAAQYYADVDATKALGTASKRWTNLFTYSASLKPVAFAALPATPAEGWIASITDGSTAIWGATVTGGGANHVLAYYNGSDWTVIAK